MLLLKALLQVYHLSFGFNGRLGKKIVITSVVSVIWWLPPFSKAFEQERCVAVAAPALAVLWVIRASALLLLVHGGNLSLTVSLSKLGHEFGSRQSWCTC